MKDYQKYIKENLQQAIIVHNQLINDEAYIKSVFDVSKMLINTFNASGKVMIAGNGGSAADAQHIAGELVNKFNFDRPSLPCISLCTDTSVITAVGNDYSYEAIFEKQINALGNNGDLFIGITTSGTSKNIVKAAKAAKEKNMKVVILTGNKKTELDELSDYVIHIPSSNTPLIQQLHVLTYHTICAIVEEEMFA